MYDLVVAHVPQDVHLTVDAFRVRLVDDVTVDVRDDEQAESTSQTTSWRACILDR